ncbi:caspase-8-like isoform X2 [Dendropsophus ebraccatus]|uniref:caspase-8-like isoform X2 n=1 Tax=Dendropsophus ebraccatus TaxID=150705 RepID=UPI003832055D
MDKDTQSLLLKVSEELTERDASGMIFLCGKYLKEGEKENMKDGMALFSSLKKKSYISKDNLLFVKELLSRIGRRDILKNVLNITDTEIKELERSFQKISKYRSVLYDIAVNLCSEETEKFIFLLDGDIRHTEKLNKAKCMMLVLCEMEKQMKISEGDLHILNSYLVDIGRSDLSDKIKYFENEQNNQRQGADARFEKMSIQEEPPSDVNVSSIQPDDIRNDLSSENIEVEEYKLDKIPHGLCIIVDNHNFKNHEQRKGTEKDADAIEKVFKSRNYGVIRHKDLTGEGILKIMKYYADKCHNDYDSFICFVLSHGEKGIVFGTDWEEVPVKDITNCFNGLKCPSLVGKPKVFFIQACQGDKFDPGVTYASDNNTAMYVGDAKTLPVTADFLTAFACVEDYVSLRSTVTGSVYIQTLCTVLQNHQFLEDFPIWCCRRMSGKIRFSYVNAGHQSKQI